MKVIYTKKVPIPFDGFLAINLFGVLFVKEKYKQYLSETVFNHERIHTEQMKELGYVFFYIWYLIEWLYRVLFTKDFFSYNAYKHLSFEQEAYKNERNLDYLKTRKRYAWFKFYKKKR